MRNVLKKLAYSILACILVLTTVAPVTAKAETVTDKERLDVQVDNVTSKYMSDEDFKVLREKMEYTIVDDEIKVKFYNENSEIYINYDNSLVSPECVVSNSSERLFGKDGSYKTYYEVDKVGVYQICAMGVKAKRDETDKLVIESVDELSSYYLDSYVNENNKFGISKMDELLGNYNNILPTTISGNTSVPSVNYCGGSNARSKVKVFLEKKGSVSDYDLLIYRYYYALDYQGNENNKWCFTDKFFLPEGQETVFNLSDKKEETQQPEDTYTKELAKDAEVMSDTDFATVLAENATKDVVIKNANGVIFTFEKGTMSAVDGKTEYDFGTNIISEFTQATELSSEVTNDNFVLQIDYNYSGQLPAKASITFNVGSELAGKTLYYYLYSTDKTYKIVQSVVVAEDGSVTVQQDHCSSYVLTNAELVTETPADDTPIDETPATGDSTNLALYFIMLALASLGVIVLVSRKRMSERA